MISFFLLAPARVPGLVSVLSFPLSGRGLCSIVIFWLLLVPGWGSGVCLPSFLSFLFSGMGHPMNSLLRMNVVETWFVAVWGLCWCNYIFLANVTDLLLSFIKSLINFLAVSLCEIFLVVYHSTTLSTLAFTSSFKVRFRVSTVRFQGSTVPRFHGSVPRFGFTVPRFHGYGSTVPRFGFTVPRFSSTVRRFGSTVPRFVVSRFTVPRLSSTVPRFDGSVPRFHGSTVPRFGFTVPRFHGSRAQP